MLRKYILTVIELFLIPSGAFYLTFADVGGFLPFMKIADALLWMGVPILLVFVLVGLVYFAGLNLLWRGVTKILNVNGL